MASSCVWSASALSVPRVATDGTANSHCRRACRGWRIGKRESYPPGTFSWSDLGTTDRDAARAFYGELFGWLVYFGVEDIEASLALIERLGGGTIVGATDIGVARIAVVTDPQGAVFAIYAGAFED